MEVNKLVSGSKRLRVPSHCTLAGALTGKIFQSCVRPALAVSLLLFVSALPLTVQAQSAQGAIDALNPFAHIVSPEEWWDKFHTGKPDIVPNDPWGNMTPSEYVNKETGGYWSGQPGMTPAKIMGLHEPDPRGERASRQTGGIGVVLRSPYPYKTAKEQYDAWLAAADGGTRKTRAALPDWSGDWAGGAQGVLHGNARISDVMAGLSPEYRQRYRQLLEAEWEGHAWWPQAFCMPHGYPQTLSGNGGTWHFMSDEHMVLINKDRDSDAFFDIYTDGRGFSNGKLGPQWYGESIGFWDGDQLVVYTKNVKPWVMAVALPEVSDKLETVTRIKRFGDEMLMDITLYDSEAFSYPWHDVAILQTLKDWTTAPQSYVSCVYSNNVYLAPDGSVDEHLPGDAGYRDTADPRPWATAFKLWDEHHPELAAKWKAAFQQDFETSASAK